MEFSKPKKQKIIKEYSDILKQFSQVCEGQQDARIKLNTPEIFTLIDQRFDVEEKYLHAEIPHTHTHIQVNKIRYKINLEPNILFNDLKILIPNPYKIPTNSLIKSFEIVQGGSIMYKLTADIETHIKVLKHFLNASESYNEQTQSTELSIGFVHNKILISTYINWDIDFILETTMTNTPDIKFYANLYKIKEFNGTDTYKSNDPYDINKLSNNSSFRKFLKTEVQSFENLFTDTKSELYFNHPVSAIYLTQINPNLVKSIRLLINNDLVLDFTKEELINTNKYQHGIDSDQVIIIFNSDILNTSLNTINFSRIDQVYLEVNTWDCQLIPYTVNALSTNIQGINTKCISMVFYAN